MSKQTNKEDKFIKELANEVNRVADELLRGNYSVRCNINTDNSLILKFQNDLNRIIDVLQLNMNSSLIGENSIINDFVEVFSLFAQSNFSKKLPISDEGTILDSIAAGVNMLGEELEKTTVTKNELLIERNRLEEAQKIANICDWEYYLENDNFVCSQEFFEITELKPAKFPELVEEYQKKMLKEDYDTFITKILDELKQNNSVNFVNRIYSKSNDIKYLLYTINHIKNEEQTIGYKGVIQDITELKRTQIELQHKTNLQQLITEISTRFINETKVDFKKNINIILEDCCKFFDVDRSYFLRLDATNLNVLELFEFCSENVKYDMSQIQETNFDVFQWCIGALYKKKEIVHVPDLSKKIKELEQEEDIIEAYDLKSFILVPVHSKDYFAVWGFDAIRRPRYWTVDEINGLKLIANILSDALTRDYYENNLILAREKAEESDRLKSAFINNMSHEIRTPLNGIVGFSELLAGNNISSELREEYATIVKNCSNQLTTIIDDVITISSIDAGQEKVKNTTVNIYNLIEELITQFQYQIKESGKDIDLFCEDINLPENAHYEILADKTKLTQVISNLLGNAVKFTENGYIKISCDVVKEKIIFKISDSGPGIDPKHHEAIFDRFKQISVNPNKLYGGNGLGLAISKAFIELMEGEIWVSSKKGKGADFYFKIDYKPVKKLDGIGKLEDDDIEIPKDIKTVLVAEDDVSNYKLLCTILKSIDFNIVHAKDGVEAVQLFVENPDTIDVVFMDIKMPNKNGIDACKEIKKINSVIPIIAVTAFATESDKETIMKAGFDDYLSKPIEKVKLLKLISCIYN